MSDLAELRLGSDWLSGKIDGIVDTIERMGILEFNEEFRYLPESVTSMPGYIRFSVNPFMREIIRCFDVDSPVREVNLKKGVQITYSTVLESVLLYYAAHVKTLPMMFMSADKELAKARIENNVLPMFNQSDFAHLIKSSDEGNSRKTGKTEAQIQFEGGAYLVPFGAQNANKMRSFSIAVMLKDELDGWPIVVGEDGDPDALSDDRCSGYWKRRKIFRGSTPKIKGVSKIQAAYERGDQRKYLVLCFSCGFPQDLRWEAVNKETGIIGGLAWDLEDGSLILESVRYRCRNCGHEHFEHDKSKLFATEHGAHWKPTAKPAEPGIRSYHLPALYSPIGMQPWYKSVLSYLEAFDIENKKVKDIGKYKVFYNNILGEPFEELGNKIRFSSVSAHRRTWYSYGEIPNKHASEFSGSRILFLTCQVDVHKNSIYVAVMGWTSGGRCYLINYWHWEKQEKENDCTELSCSVWFKLRRLIEDTEYESDDGTKYKIILTLIDSSWANTTVVEFCSDYAPNGWVYPILGRERPAKNQRIEEFAQFKTKLGTVGYRILVDYYKDRLAPVLRREWNDALGIQDQHHFNAPIDTTDKEIKQLTAEIRREKKDTRGAVSYEWYRPGNVANELWDLLVYGNAAVDILAWTICIECLKFENVDWHAFWEFAASEENDSLFVRG